MPLIIVVLAGTFLFGLMMHAQQVITNASRIGVRRATQPQSDQEKIDNATLEYCRQAGLDPALVTIQTDVNTRISRVTVTVTYQFSSPMKEIYSVGVGAITGTRGVTRETLTATTIMRL